MILDEKRSADMRLIPVTITVTVIAMTSRRVEGKEQIDITR
jgi:hypothetical protein